MKLRPPEVGDPPAGAFAMADQIWAQTDLTSV
jgi:hypothetical protein